MDLSEWTEAKELKSGDLTFTADGKLLAISSIEVDGREETVYNFEVEDFHTYFVGESGVWVHNDESYNSGYKLGVAKSVAENTDHFIHLGNSYNLATSGDTAKTFGKHIDDYADGERLNSQNPEQFEAGYQDGQKHGFWASVGLSVAGGIAGIAGKIGFKVGSKAAVKNAPVTNEIYKRPSNATTATQRQSVQGKPCSDCGAVTNKQVADHKTPLVKEHYETGKIDKVKMKSPESIQPQCPTCSAKQGAEMSKYSKEMKKIIEQRSKDSP
jgi:hypothetical protein